MTTNRSRPLDRGISRQTFLRGGVGMLATGGSVRDHAVVRNLERTAGSGGPGWRGHRQFKRPDRRVPASVDQPSGRKRPFQHDVHPPRTWLDLHLRRH